jgi:hypothetical protein
MAESRHARTIENELKPGKPCVNIVGTGPYRFIAYDKRYLSGKSARWVAVRQPFAGQPQDVLSAYVNGNDPVKGKPFAPQIVDGLTAPPQRGRIHDRLACNASGSPYIDGYRGESPGAI